MTVALRPCPWCRQQALAPAWTVCPRCGADVSIESTLLCPIRTVPGSAAPEVEARTPGVELATAMRRETRIARHLVMVEAAGLVLQRAGCSWERVEQYLRRRGLLP